MLDFYKDKRVFITGHTGFKGSWLSQILIMAGAKVYGYSKMPSTNPSLFNILDLDKKMISKIGDIRNREELERCILEFQPEIVFHLAAQPIVRESYKDPVYTFETNVIGTVNLLESIRRCESVRSVVNITTDKVYENKEWEWGYRENESLNGFDPYSNSKSCSELVTSSYKNSFFSNNEEISVSTARAGNVIGGGDFSIDRIIPDCIRAAINNKDVVLRNPNSIRPYQHVFEALRAYLILAEKQYGNKSIEGCYNIGPDEKDCIRTKEIAQVFCKEWGCMSFKCESIENVLHEANYLKLDCSKIKSKLLWEPKMNICEAIRLTVKWSKAYFEKLDIVKVSENMVDDYFNIN